MKYNYFHLTIHRDLRKKKPVLRTDNPGTSPFSSLQTDSTCASLRFLTFLLHHLRSFEKTFPSGSFLQDALASVLGLAQCSKAPLPPNDGKTQKDGALTASYKTRLTHNHRARPRSSKPSPLPVQATSTANACGPC